MGHLALLLALLCGAAGASDRGYRCIQPCAGPFPWWSFADRQVAGDGSALDGSQAPAVAFTTAPPATAIRRSSSSRSRCGHETLGVPQRALGLLSRAESEVQVTAPSICGTPSGKRKRVKRK